VIEKQHAGEALEGELPAILGEDMHEMLPDSHPRPACHTVGGACLADDGV